MALNLPVSRPMPLKQREQVNSAQALPIKQNTTMQPTPSSMDENSTDFIGPQRPEAAPTFWQQAGNAIAQVGALPGEVAKGVVSAATAPAALLQAMVLGGDPAGIDTNPINTPPVANTARETNAAIDSFTNSYVPAPNNPVSNVLAKVTDVVGQAIPAAAATVLTGGTSAGAILVGTPLSYGIGGAQAFTNELAYGSGDVGTALTKGGTSVASEAIGGRLFANAAGIGGAIGEGLEENIAGVLDSVLTGENYSLSTAAEDFAYGAIAGGVLGGAASIMSNANTPNGAQPQSTSSSPASVGLPTTFENAVDISDLPISTPTEISSNDMNAPANIEATEDIDMRTNAEIDADNNARAEQIAAERSANPDWRIELPFSNGILSESPTAETRNSNVIPIDIFSRMPTFDLGLDVEPSVEVADASRNDLNIEADEDGRLMFDLPTSNINNVVSIEEARNMQNAQEAFDQNAVRELDVEEDVDVDTVEDTEISTDEAADIVTETEVEPQTNIEPVIESMTEQRAEQLAEEQTGLAPDGTPEPENQTMPDVVVTPDEPVSVPVEESTPMLAPNTDVTLTPNTEIGIATITNPAIGTTVDVNTVIDENVEAMPITTTEPTAEIDAQAEAQAQTELAEQIWTPAQTMRREREAERTDFNLYRGRGSQGQVYETQSYNSTFGGLSSY